MLRHAGLALIEGYQRYISPRKRYRCAYGVLHGDGTCSSIGKRIMRESGFFGFFPMMRKQFAACTAAAVMLEAKKQKEQSAEKEKGSSCDGPDCIDLTYCTDGCSGLDFCDCSW